MDERMFVDNSIRKASIATGADGNGDNGDGIFKKISVSEKRLNDKSLRGDNNKRDVDDSEVSKSKFEVFVFCILCLTYISLYLLFRAKNTEDVSVFHF